MCLSGAYQHCVDVAAGLQSAQHTAWRMRTACGLSGVHGWISLTEALMVVMLLRLSIMRTTSAAKWLRNLLDALLPCLLRCY